MPTNKQHELVDLEVEEVSLVDIPANQEKFLIIKADDGGAAPETSADATETAAAKVPSALAASLAAMANAITKAIDDLDGKEEVDADVKKATELLLQTIDVEAGRLAEGAGIEHEPKHDPLAKAREALKDDKIPAPPETTPPAQAPEQPVEKAGTADQAQRFDALESVLSSLPEAIAASITKGIAAAQANTSVMIEEAVAPLRKSVARLGRGASGLPTSSAPDSEESAQSRGAGWSQDMAPPLNR